MVNSGDMNSDRTVIQKCQCEISKKLTRMCYYCIWEPGLQYFPGYIENSGFDGFKGELKKIGVRAIFWRRLYVNGIF